MIKDEIRNFKKTNQRGMYLEFVFELLKGIKPSTVDVERVFSSCGLIVTKLRTRLSDSTIDHYLFLRYYFLNLDRYKAGFKDFKF